MIGLRVELDFHDERPVVKVGGELDLVTAEQFAEALRLTSGPVTVDMAKLSFIDSTGIAVLAYQWREGRDVKLRGAHGVVRRALEITGFADHLAD